MATIPALVSRSASHFTPSLLYQCEVPNQADLSYILAQVPGKSMLKFFFSNYANFFLFLISFLQLCGSYISSAIYFSSDMTPWIIQRIRVCHAITATSETSVPYTLTVRTTDILRHVKKECALAHSRASRGRLRQSTSSRECASLARQCLFL